MPSLKDRTWNLKYTPDDGDLVGKFYVPALQCATRYDRSTGYFSAKALTLAMRGIEGLVANNGRMRLVVGCTLDAEEVEAIEKGLSLRTVLENRAASGVLLPPDDYAKDALELLAWMIEHHYLDVKLAIPCDQQRRPMNAEGIFHEKAGVIDDAEGNRIAFIGSLNETYPGWKTNWESFAVYTSWTGSAENAAREAEDFAKIWADKATRVITVDVPTAVREGLLQFLPASDQKPKRLQAAEPDEIVIALPLEDGGPPPATGSKEDLRAAVWNYIKHAPGLLDGGERVGEATCAVNPWPHQLRAFARLYHSEAPRLLIADEVGLGKTIQAGMLLRQMWLSGRAKRILVLTPAGVMKQWQVELREKFNLSWPVYDDGALSWYPTLALDGANERNVDRADWHKEQCVIASSHLMRRRDREKELIEHAEPWDLIILDEAHHARRKGAGSGAEKGPNSLLRLLHKLRDRTKGLVLLTATPMQVDPIEVWDLLSVLGLPTAWTESAFRQFFRNAAKPAPSADEFDQLASLFRATESFFGATPDDVLNRLHLNKGVRARRILSALRDAESGIRRLQLESGERRTAIDLMKAATPVSRLISRHTRGLLRQYYQAGKISTPIATRDVRDEFVDLSSAERKVYDAVEDYISTTYNQVAATSRNAVGFVMTVYRRRLASSFFALRTTLENRLSSNVDSSNHVLAPERGLAATDDISDDESDDVMDRDEASRLEREALLLEEKSDIEALLLLAQTLPPDSKANQLKDQLSRLQQDGYTQVMVFTQFTDTMDFLRNYLTAGDSRSILCFSGRGGERRDHDGNWTPISRDQVKAMFRDGQADILLCTDAAAEGLNFQFCGALVNYDMPWNPMRVEQRIGRIDRLGQKFAKVRIVNLHYRDTVETDVYLALRRRISLFESVVGRLQPILSQMPRVISASVLRRPRATAESRAQLAADMTDQVDALENDGTGLDLDQVVQDDLEMPSRPSAALDLDLLDAIIRRGDLLPHGIEASEMRVREYQYLAPGMDRPLRVTTDPVYFEQHSDSVELWSAGSPLFPAPNNLPGNVSLDSAALRTILN